LEKELVAAEILDFRIYLDRKTLVLFAAMDVAENHFLDLLPKQATMKK